MRVPPSGRAAGRHEHARDAFRHSGFVGSWFAEVDRAVASAAERQGFDEVVKLLGGLQLARLASATKWSLSKMAKRGSSSTMTQSRC